MGSYIKKVCLLGDPGVGKTSLIRKFVKDDFNDSYISTLGAKVSETNLQIIDDKATPFEVTLTIWDIAGQQTFSNINPLMYYGAAGALIVADLTRNETVKTLSHWLYEFDKETKSPVIFLGNKSDMLETEEDKTLRREMNNTLEKLRQLAASYSSPVLTTSAKTGENVEKAFKLLCQMILFGKINEEAFKK